MQLLNLNEHTSCYNYVTDMTVGFRYYKALNGEFRDEQVAEYNHLIFVIKGQLLVACDYFVDQRIDEGEMFFVAKSSRFSGETLDDSEILILSYDNITDLCNKVSMSNLDKECKDMVYTFAPLSIRKPLDSFLELMILYLDAGANCICLHELKLEELFWLLRAFYKKRELAMFFFPIIGNSLEFRDRVMVNYKKAGTAQELARLCGYSRQQFNKLFLEEFRTSPYSWMQERLLLHLKSRLADISIPLKSIVDEFELSSMPHFVRLCKNKFGKTPSELRRELVECNSDMS